MRFTCVQKTVTFKEGVEKDTTLSTLFRSAVLFLSFSRTSQYDHIIMMNLKIVSGSLYLFTLLAKVKLLL